MELTLCIAQSTGNKKNCVYPTRIDVTTPEIFKQAVSFDHVCAVYVKNRRSKDSFISSNVVVMDCDNDHSNNPDEWITPQNMQEKLGDISYVIVPSRHNMLEKEGLSARPRFHVYFPIAEVKNADEYVTIKKAIHHDFPFFDNNALDAARFIYGCDIDEITWHEGWTIITDMLSGNISGFNQVADEILEGERNNQLSHYAGRILKRFGDTDDAFQMFLNKANKCNPPLEDSELESIWTSAKKFAAKVQKQAGYIPPDQYNKSDFVSKSLKPEDYSDIGQAKVIASQYNDELRYTEGTDYIRYNGNRWVESRQQAVAAAEEFLDLQLEDAELERKNAIKALVNMGKDEADVISGGKKFEAELSEKQMKAYIAYLAAEAYLRFVQKRRDMKYIISALQAAKPMLELDVAELDKNGYLINTPGMTFDVSKKDDTGHIPEASDFLTKQTLCQPGDKGKEIWEEALNTFFCGDTELIEYVQKTVGLAAIGKVYVEALVIAYGDGSNGKSTFWNTISKVMGSYSGSISADALTVGCKRNVNPEIAELKGKRLVIAAELEEGTRLNTSIVKKLCSTDEIEAEKKYKDPFRFVPSHTVVLYTNHLPRVGALDEGTWRRLIIIPFNAKIKGRSDIKNYAEYLVENAGEAVMQWIIEGASKAYECDFRISPPTCVKEAINQYKETNDWMSSFLEECCEMDPKAMQKSGEFYQEYRNYCVRNGEYIRGTADFYTALENFGFKRHRLPSGSFIKGVKLQSEFLK